MWDHNQTRKGMWDDFKKVERKEKVEKVIVEETSEKCSICMNNMVGDIHELNCGHQFHHHCIKDLFCVYMSDRCPMCRANYKYQPSKKRKPKRRMRKKMLKYHTNQYGVMTRQKCADMYYYFISRKISMPFLKQMIKVLRIRYDYNFIKYFGDTIFLYTQEKPSCTGGLVYQNRDLKIEDFHEQEQFRQALIPLSPRIEDNESYTDYESDDEDEDLETTSEQLNQQRYIRDVAIMYDLNVFHVTQMFTAFNDFRREIEILELDDHTSSPDLMHAILLHVIDGWDHTTEDQDYDDDVRICNMYNIEQPILDHLYHITPGFNVSYLENKAAREGHMDDLQNWVREQIFVEAIEAEQTYLECDINNFDDLVKMVPDNDEWKMYITTLRDNYSQPDDYWNFMRSVTYSDGGIYEQVMDWFKDNVHGI